MKNLIGIILLVVIGTIAYWLLTKEQKPKQHTEDYRDFAIEDTAAVDRLFMSKKNGEQITISRRETGEWMVNGEFPAVKHSINLLLKTFHDIQIRGNVGKEKYNSVVKRLATSAIKVEIYTGEKKPHKIWYVGHETADNLGTYMLLEKDGVKSSKPYMTHLLMERGYLYSRFFLDPNLWKERALMKINPQEIKRISVNHAYDSATSFSIEQLRLDSFQLTNLSTNEVEDIQLGTAIPYFKSFSTVFYEYQDMKTDSIQLDSIYGASPRHTVTIETMEGKIIQMKTFNMPVPPGSLLEGKPIYFHPERMYAYSSELDGDIYPVVQNFSFDALVPSLEILKSSTTVEK